ncbi:hypothetical protein F2P81_023704 [Scophthalmus maximus]|uniref:Tc1-like transposase DDE domain-containing protein n=1 Tax=Scophthalmus maximus TaxID=52904 RepID=A0A6A4RX89_SCOMX|nr:hypothetical protein F2P81_023704 [Scophthalmus maximus]
MKQLYWVPFERNSVRVKHLRHDYVQRVLDFDAAELPHEFIYVDEAGFNLAKTRRRGRNVVGQRAVANVPGQRGGNITLCAAISVQGVLHLHATIGPYNTGQIIAFLDALHAVVQDRPEQPSAFDDLSSVMMSYTQTPQRHAANKPFYIMSAVIFRHITLYKRLCLPCQSNRRMPGYRIQMLLYDST